MASALFAVVMACGLAAETTAFLSHSVVSTARSPVVVTSAKHLKPPRVALEMNLLSRRDVLWNGMVIPAVGATSTLLETASAGAEDVSIGLDARGVSSSIPCLVSIPPAKPGSESWLCCSGREAGLGTSVASNQLRHLQYTRK
jgi:hypothetical protein